MVRCGGLRSFFGLQALLVLAAACDDLRIEVVGGPGGAGAGGAGAGGAGGAAGGEDAGEASSGGEPSCDEANGEHLDAAGTACTTAPRFLCVFDYDLTLSSHACPMTEAEPERYLCRRNADACPTYGWFEQCVGVSAREAVAACVRRGAYLGIASHSLFTECWDDKIASLFTPENVPELFASVHYASSGTDFSYPDLLAPESYNCEDCAYQVRGESKSALIRRVMTHYGLDPTDPADQRRVAFWDDDLKNTTNVVTELPGVVTIKVPVLGDPAARQGCGIGPAEIDDAWARLGAR
jgi:hypothetical protein